MKQQTALKHKHKIVSCAARCTLAFALTFFGICNAMAQEEKHLSREYVNNVEDFAQQKSWTQAKREIDRGLELYPDDPDLRYWNGEYYYQTGNLKESRYNLVRSIQENDQHFRSKRRLVDVEDSLRHYSSAICYINELLEFQPYDRDLWRRKIGLFKKIGQNVEANEALERLARIYPNDSLVRHDLRNRNRETWNIMLQRGSLGESANQLEKYLETDSLELDYYLQLMSIYQRQGENERALGVANRGLRFMPRQQEIVNRAIAIMIDMGLYTRALAFAKQHLGESTLYNNILREVADDARLRDPYDVTGRLYALTKDQDALTYLLNTSLTRGYYDDAQVYLQESYTRYGRTFDLVSKQYGLEKRFGNEQAQYRLLQELYTLNPGDEELTKDYADMMIELAHRELTQEQWEDAYLHLDRIINILTPKDEEWATVVSQQITLLGRLNRYEEARDLYRKASARSLTYRKRFASAYEDVAATRLRGLIEEEHYETALKEAQALLTIVPNSEVALRTCINMSQTLKKEKLFHNYAKLGYEAYPNVPYFIVKRATSLQQQGQNANALALLHPRTGENEEYINPQLMTASSGFSQEWASELLKERMPDIALQVVDSALVYDPTNKELLYTKGLAHEALKQFAEAWEYQYRYYNPSNAEQLEWYQHMRYLRFRSFRNRIDASYTWATYYTRSEELVSTAHLYSLASVSYSRLTKRNTYTGQISYKGVDGDYTGTNNESGGVGLEFMGQWEHTFNHRWSGLANLSYGTRYFNRWGANVALSYAANRGWTPSLRLGYRRTPPTSFYKKRKDETGEIVYEEKYEKYNLFLITPSVTKSWERLNMSAAVDLALIHWNLYYNATLKGKLFINEDNISSVSLMAGFGSFPELAFFDQSVLQNISHTNAMIGFDAQYLLTKHLYLGLTGTWNTYYSPYYRQPQEDENGNVIARGRYLDSYRNIFIITAQLHVAF